MFSLKSISKLQLYNVPSCHSRYLKKFYGMKTIPNFDISNEILEKINSLNGRLDKEDIPELKTLFKKSTYSYSAASSLLDKFTSSNIDNWNGKRMFLSLWQSELGIQREKVIKKANAFLSAKEHAYYDSELELKKTLIPDAEKVLLNIAGLPNGLCHIMMLREISMELLSRKNPSNTPEEKQELENVQKISNMIKEYMKYWFLPGFLKIERISQGSEVNYLMNFFEASSKVYPITEENATIRFSDTRRVFRLYHSINENINLAFLDVAFTSDIPSQIKPLLNEEQVLPENAKCAIFYSVVNNSTSLSGINIGRTIILKAIETLKNEYRNIRIYCTLSPVPGFSSWLDKELSDPNQTDDISGIITFEGNELDELTFATEEYNKKKIPMFRLLKKILADRDWKKMEFRQLLEPILVRWCAQYLTDMRSKKSPDPISNFNFSNGASLYKINHDANRSKKAYDESYGIMVNYLYSPGDLEKQSEDYRNGYASISESIVLVLDKVYDMSSGTISSNVETRKSQKKILTDGEKNI